MRILAYKVKDAEQVLGIKTTKLYEHIRAGRLVAVKSGRSTLITADSIEKFLDSLPRIASPKPSVKRLRLTE